MKTRTKKIGGTLTRILMALIVISSWAVLGVALALKSANVQMSGSISFKATEIFADITGSVSGTATTNTLGDIHIKSDTTQEQINGMATGWGNMTLDFTSDNLITVTVNITNKAKDRAVWVSLTDEIDETNLTITRQVATYTWDNVAGMMNDNHTTVTGKFRDAIKVEPAVEVVEGMVQNGSATIEVTMSVADLNASIDNTNFGLGITLSNEEPVADASEYPTMVFTYDDDTMTASVGANTSNEPTGSVVVPSYVKNGTSVYKVTELYQDRSGEKNGFYQCSKLTSIELPETIEKIEALSFYGCSSLEKITISSNTILIENLVFEGCTALQYNIYENGNYIGNDDNPYHMLISVIDTSVSTFKVHDDCKSIGYGVFKTCSSLSSVTMPSGVRALNSNAFSYDIGTGSGNLLKEITLPSSLEYLGNGVFQLCSSLTFTNDIPSTVKHIGTYAFYGTKLTSVTIPEGCNYIGTYAFYDVSLTSVTFENPNGWMVTPAGGGVSTAISSADLTDASTALSTLRNYKTYTWTRSDAE